MGNLGLAYNSHLWEGLPSQTNRYAEPIIQGTVAAAQEEDITSNPNDKHERRSPDAGISAVSQGWKEYIHPVEGDIHFYNEELRIVTGVCIRHDIHLSYNNVLARLMNWHGIFVTLRDQVQPEAAVFDVLLDCSSEENIVWHYLVDRPHPVRVGASLNEEYWTHVEYFPKNGKFDLTSARIKLQAVLANSVLGALLNEEYWTHAEYMPKNDNHLADARSELQAALASSMLDHMTSEGSTSPFTTEECNAYLLALDKVAELGRELYLNWSIGRQSRRPLTVHLNKLRKPYPEAHVMGLPAHSRNVNMYGQYGARLDQTATIEGRRHSVRSSSYLYRSKTLGGGPEIHLNRLENLWVDRIIYTHHWRALLRDLIEKRTSASATLIIDTELLSSTDVVLAASTGVNAIPWTGWDRRRSVGTALHPHHNGRRKGPFKQHPSHIRNIGPPKTATIFRSTMGNEEVMKCLVEHGCQDITNDLDLGSASSEPIAWGGVGKIYFAKLRSGTEVAIKCLFNLGHVDKSEKNSTLLKHTAREIYTWSKCDHPGVVRMRGIALFRGQVAMVSEWMRNGSLRGFIREHPSFDRIQLCVQLAETLEYIHARKIVHGDIKPDNVLMSDDHTPLFTDFGNAFLMYEASLQFSSTTFGTTARYAAPEVLSEASDKPSTETDIYSFGMTVLEVVTGEVPFANYRKPISLFMAVGVRGEIPKRPDLSLIFSEKALEDEFWGLITRCWDSKPNNRPSSSELRIQLTSIWESLTHASAN
ncbi:hypothetical protein FRC09_014898 [Ceratobasidium sp. 395]|nr:hypothetical protein FRC09_014898 [Ceratobasidium sp. 395]